MSHGARSKDGGERGEEIDLFQNKPCGNIWLLKLCDVLIWRESY